MTPEWSRRLRPFAVPNLTNVLIGVQAIMYLAIMIRHDFGIYARCMLQMESVYAGEYWRLLTVLALPSTTSPFWFLMGIYCFWFMGGALEARWGELRYTLFIAAGWAATVAAGILFPAVPLDNTYIGLVVFLTFAFLHPDVEFMLFVFFCPVKVKWFALVSWILLGITFLSASWALRVQIAVALLAYFIFLRHELALRLRSGGKKMARRAEALHIVKTCFHTCSVCGKTDLTHPDLEFRVSSRTGKDYCVEHLPGSVP